VARRFDSLTGGAFERWVTVESQPLLSQHTVASQAVVLFDAALGTLASERFGPPSLVAGYSLGFYAAASIAGVFPMELALEWIGRVNRAMDPRFPPGSFGLAVSIGLTREDLLRAFGDASLDGLEVANINNARQLVFAGPADEVDSALKILEGRVLSAKALPLGFPLHTSYLRPIAQELEPWWRSVSLSDPQVPLLSPVDGSRLTGAEQVRETMLLSLTEPTDWVSVVKAAGKAGLSWVLDTSGDGSLGRMTRWVDRSMRVVPYREALGPGGFP
jgi:malonyl CoA-acyl carrier protein transacylase